MWAVERWVIAQEDGVDLTANDAVRTNCTGQWQRWLGHQCLHTFREAVVLLVGYGAESGLLNSIYRFFSHPDIDDSERNNILSIMELSSPQSSRSPC